MQMSKCHTISNHISIECTAQCTRFVVLVVTCCWALYWVTYRRPICQNRKLAMLPIDITHDLQCDSEKSYGRHIAWSQCRRWCASLDREGLSGRWLVRWNTKFVWTTTRRDARDYFSSNRESITVMISYFHQNTHIGPNTTIQHRAVNGISCSRDHRQSSDHTKIDFAHTHTKS